MGIFLPAGGGLAPGLSLNVPSIPTRINVDFFFDRATVRNAISRTKHQALYRAGSVVMQMARRSIAKKGMAKPQLKVMQENPGVPLRQLLKNDQIPNRTRSRIRERLVEIQEKRASDPGSPPFTHTGIFRRGITYQFDPSTESVVVGQTLPGGAWLASLHEFGGSQQMTGWAYSPRFPRSYKSGIIGWWRVGRSPRNKSRWVQTSFRESKPYPARPYMQPAMLRAAQSGRIAKEFANRFKVGGL